MKEFLIFSLYGPFASWGDIAVGESRPSFMQPTKSAIIGLIASALGIKRHEEERLESLSSSLGFAVCMNSPGTLLRDYHTVQVPSSSKIKYYTRKDELEVGSLNTILSSRDYRMDAYYVICVWIKNIAREFSLSTIEEHLKNPVFTLYLGRKSCVLSFPLFPKIIMSENLRSAFENFICPGDVLLNRIVENQKIKSYYWETEPLLSSGFENIEIHEVIRRDIPLSKKRWQFEERTESYCSVSTDMKEEVDVS